MFRQKKGGDVKFPSVCCECFIFIGYKEAAFGQWLMRVELSERSRLRCKEKEKVGRVRKKSCNCRRRQISDTEQNITGRPQLHAMHRLIEMG